MAVKLGVVGLLSLCLAKWQPEAVYHNWWTARKSASFRFGLVAWVNSLLINVVFSRTLSISTVRTPEVDKLEPDTTTAFVINSST